MPETTTIDRLGQTYHGLVSHRGPLLEAKEVEVGENIYQTSWTAAARKNQCS